MHEISYFLKSRTWYTTFRFLNRTFMILYNYDTFQCDKYMN